MNSYVGTVLGGPRDGEIYVADRPDILMHEPPPRAPFEFDEDPDPAYLPPPPASRHLARYEWRQDDDRRGWWVRHRP